MSSNIEGKFGGEFHATCSEKCSIQVWQFLFFSSGLDRRGLKVKNLSRVLLQISSSSVQEIICLCHLNVDIEKAIVISYFSVNVQMIFKRQIRHWMETRWFFPVTIHWEWDLTWSQPILTHFISLFPLCPHCMDVGGSWLELGCWDCGHGN